jgi:hypothetical protein
MDHPELHKAHDDNINELIDEYCQWQSDNGLSPGGAGAHLSDDDLTIEQQGWLERYCERWERAEAARPATATTSWVVVADE